LIPCSIAIVRYSELDQPERADWLVGCEACLDPESLVEHSAKVIVDPIKALRVAVFNEAAVSLRQEVPLGLLAGVEARE
jgi:hypothetical protein